MTSAIAKTDKPVCDLLGREEHLRLYCDDKRVVVHFSQPVWFYLFIKRIECENIQNRM
jgi:hypothetical protein